MQNRKIIVKGVGKVGTNLVGLLKKNGAEVIVADISGCSQARTDSIDYNQANN